MAGSGLLNKSCVQAEACRNNFGLDWSLIRTVFWGKGVNALRELGVCVFIFPSPEGLGYGRLGYGRIRRDWESENNNNP